MTNRLDKGFGEMKAEKTSELYVVVDVETAGPVPGEYALLSIGACTLEHPRKTFYIELQPDTDNIVAHVAEIHSLSLDRLSVEGTPPAAAMRSFADWVSQVSGGGVRPVFTAFNAPFDWMFVSHYFMRYLGYNPFGHSALDIKAYYMGLHGTCWADTSYRFVSQHYQKQPTLQHHALQDAMDAADLFELMLEEIKTRKGQV